MCLSENGVENWFSADKNHIDSSEKLKNALIEKHSTIYVGIIGENLAPLSCFCNFLQSSQVSGACIDRLSSTQSTLNVPRWCMDYIAVKFSKLS